MALESDDLIIVQKGDGSHAKATVGDITTGGGGGVPDLQAVTDEGSTTTNGATFGQAVTIGAFNDRATNGVTSLVNANVGGGGASFTAANADAGGYNWLGYNFDSSQITSTISSNGSATFASQITATKGYALAQLDFLPD